MFLEPGSLLLRTRFASWERKRRRFRWRGYQLPLVHLRPCQTLPSLESQLNPRYQYQLSSTSARKLYDTAQITVITDSLPQKKTKNCTRTVTWNKSLFSAASNSVACTGGDGSNFSDHCAQFATPSTFTGPIIRRRCVEPNRSEL